MNLVKKLKNNNEISFKEFAEVQLAFNSSPDFLSIFKNLKEKAEATKNPLDYFRLGDKYLQVWDNDNALVYYREAAQQGGVGCTYCN